MPKAYILVGVPGSGKSTWVSEQPWARDCAYVSTDQYVEEYARALGKTYSEVFDDAMPRAVEYMARDVQLAVTAGQDVIWDQTSTTIKTRRRKFNMLRGYEVVAVVFPTPDPDELARRLASRPGKNIPYSVMRRMINWFEMPTLDEGFSEIIVLDK